jgi:pimeloyl-ACP methyl ester carboxylesterase
MKVIEFISNNLETPRHKTAYLSAGPADGHLMIFIHGWPELSLVWRSQLEFFAAKGWHCIAPDMRGYGGSSVHGKTGSYAISEIVTDMLELHDALGGEAAVWIGHDWGSPIVWSLSAHYPARCSAVVNMCVPYFARGSSLSNFTKLVDRKLYPADKYPVGQWDYYLFYKEHFIQAAQDFEKDVEATINVLYRTSSPDGISKPAMSANIRAQGGWFGNARRAAQIPRDTAFLPEPDFKTLVEAFNHTGFKGANAWYLNDEVNQQYASTALNFGALTLTVLFLHAAWDSVCDTVHSQLAEPMREDCTDLTEVVIEAGHELQIEKPTEVNKAIYDWLVDRKI